MRALLYSIREWEATKAANLHASKLLCAAESRWVRMGIGAVGILQRRAENVACELCDVTICGCASSPLEQATCKTFAFKHYQKVEPSA
jgi:hypothetical protein